MYLLCIKLQHITHHLSEIPLRFYLRKESITAVSTYPTCQTASTVEYIGDIRMQQRRRVSTRHINRTIKHVVSTHLWCASFSSCDRPRISLPVSFCPVFLVHSFSRTRNLQLAIQSATDQSLHDPAYQSITLELLENVEHCRGKPGQADTWYMSLMSDVRHQVNHPPTCTSIYNSQGALQVFLLVGLLICHFI